MPLRRNRARSGLLAFVLVGAVGLVLQDVMTAARYHPVRVQSVQLVEYRGRFIRLVGVEAGGRDRLLPLADPYIQTAPGGRVCLAEKRFLLRQWTRYAVQPPQFCPGLATGATPEPGLWPQG